MALPIIEAYEMPTATDVSAAGVAWRPEASRAVLLIHDMQAYFVAAFPQDEPPVTDLVAHIARLRSAAKRLGMPVIYTAQPGSMSREQRGLLHDFWGAGMSSEPEGRQIVAPLAPDDGDVVLTKWRYSAFHGTTLANLMHRQRRDQLVVCGIYAHIGCLMTVCDAFSRDIEPFLVADAVADFSLPQHLMALDYAARKCAATMPTRTLLDLLAEPATTPPPPLVTTTRSDSR